MYKNRHLIRDDFLQNSENKIIPSTGSLLDLGCGEGGNAIYFQNAGYSAAGVDASENAIRLAKKMPLPRKVMRYSMWLIY